MYLCGLDISGSDYMFFSGSRTMLHFQALALCSCSSHVGIIVLSWACRLFCGQWSAIDHAACTAGATVVQRWCTRMYATNCRTRLLGAPAAMCSAHRCCNGLCLKMSDEVRVSMGHAPVYPPSFLWHLWATGFYQGIEFIVCMLREEVSMEKQFFSELPHDL